MSKFRLNKILKKTKRPNKAFVNWGSAISFLVLIEGKSIEEMNKRTHELRKIFAEKHVIVFGFLTTKDKKRESTQAIFDKVLTKKDLTLFKNPPKITMEWIKNTPCDILIDLIRPENTMANILVASSEAKMKCGQQSSIPQLFDLMIRFDTPPTEDELLNQLLFYIKSIGEKKD